MSHWCEQDGLKDFAAAAAAAAAAHLTAAVHTTREQKIGFFSFSPTTNSQENYGVCVCVYVRLRLCACARVRERRLVLFYFVLSSLSLALSSMQQDGCTRSLFLLFCYLPSICFSLLLCLFI